LEKNSLDLGFSMPYNGGYQIEERRHMTTHRKVNNKKAAASYVMPRHRSMFRHTAVGVIGNRLFIVVCLVAIVAYSGM